MLKKEAREITGGLSKPSKMPGPAHNLPAVACKTGAKLAQVPGSVCAGCYALKGRYRFNNVQAALQRRLKALEHPQLGGSDGAADQGPGLVQVARLRRHPEYEALREYIRSVQAYKQDQTLDANARSSVPEAAGPCHNSG